MLFYNQSSQFLLFALVFLLLSYLDSTVGSFVYHLCLVDLSDLGEIGR